MSEHIKVSVFCLAYNHEKYIRNSLEGFVMQKTNFQFEVLIHDDASTDGTADIIREYEEKYPNIIKPIYQTENQYSQKIPIIKTYLFPKAKGEYFAWCEGDDYWTDPLKLQKQIDFLENNLDYSTCSHCVRVRDLANNWDSIIPIISKSREFTAEEIIKGGALFQLSSIVMRKDVYINKPNCFNAIGFGDIQLYIYGAIAGKFMVLDDIMSVYNHGTLGSWTERNKGNIIAGKFHTNEKIKMFNNVNKYYDFKYNDAFKYALNREYFNLAKCNNDTHEMKKVEYREFYNRYRKSKVISFLKGHFPWLNIIKKTFRKLR